LDQKIRGDYKATMAVYKGPMGDDGSGGVAVLDGKCSAKIDSFNMYAAVSLGNTCSALAEVVIDSEGKLHTVLVENMPEGSRACQGAC
jgi:hypothetical protein